MNDLDKAQLALEGRCTVCGELKEEHLPSNCEAALKDFAKRMDRVLDEDNDRYFLANNIDIIKYLLEPVKDEHGSIRAGTTNTRK